LIAAGTASGKTEAAFFPVITKIYESFSAGGGAPGVNALYVSPLKALINDQAERLEPLLEKAGIPLWRWHGDVGEGAKHKLLENPSGILQITPESLEALLVRRPGHIKSLFSSLEFIIIDEIHAFIGTDRGSELLCQAERIRSMCGMEKGPRRIGLSATLGDYGEALEWLSGGTGREARLIASTGKASRRVSLAVDWYGDARFYPALYEQCRPDEEAPFRKCIIFTNSRLEAEETIAALKETGENRGEGTFHVHHGSVSAALREETERYLREGEGASTIAATATLEMGIDIGKLDRIIQIGAPLSVAAFVQRLGRSGRRLGRSQMYFTSREYPEADLSPLAKIPWTLLKTVAVIELYLREKWTEDSSGNPLPYSLLCHETMSVLMSQGETVLEKLVDQILAMPPFKNIACADYREILGRLAAGGYIEKTESGGIILGLEGEQLANHYSFYSVFPAEEEYRVVLGGREIGRVNYTPPEGSALVLGGRVWRVSAVNKRAREIHVSVSAGGEAPARIWRGGGGELHPRIARKMREVLAASNAGYPYLTAAAAARLEEGRTYARESGAARDVIVTLPSPSEGRYLFFFIPWLGSKAMRTLELIFRNEDYSRALGIVSLESENRYAYRILSKIDEREFKVTLDGIIESVSSSPDALINLINADDIPYVEKYDYLLPPHLFTKQYARGMLDPQGLRALSEECL
jgi:ATP-dependent Lhr-like helicase